MKYRCAPRCRHDSFQFVGNLLKGAPSVTKKTLLNIGLLFPFFSSQFAPFSFPKDALSPLIRARLHRSRSVPLFPPANRFLLSSSKSFLLAFISQLSLYQLSSFKGMGTLAPYSQRLSSRLWGVQVPPNRSFSWDLHIPFSGFKIQS